MCRPLDGHLYFFYLIMLSKHKCTRNSLCSWTAKLCLYLALFSQFRFREIEYIFFYHFFTDLFSLYLLDAAVFFFALHLTFFNCFLISRLAVRELWMSLLLATSVNFSIKMMFYSMYISFFNALLQVTLFIWFFYFHILWWKTVDKNRTSFRPSSSWPFTTHSKWEKSWIMLARCQWHSRPTI